VQIAAQRLGTLGAVSDHQPDPSLIPAPSAAMHDGKNGLRGTRQDAARDDQLSFLPERG